MALYRILHLYSESMDLYGDYANLTAIKRAFESIGHECVINHYENWHEIDTTDYELVYIGHGKARNLAAMREHFVKYSSHIKEQIEAGQVFFVTGNARLLFGKTLELYDGQIAQGIGLFDYHGRETGEVFVSDVLASPVFNPEITTYGFINRTSHIVGENVEPLFNVRFGKGDNENDGFVEGNLHRNYLGTWQMGPLLVRNPELLLDIMGRMMGEEPPLGVDLRLEREALRLTLVEFIEYQTKLAAKSKKDDKAHAESKEKRSIERHKQNMAIIDENERIEAEKWEAKKGEINLIKQIIAEEPAPAIVEDIDDNDDVKKKKRKKKEKNTGSKGTAI